MDVQLLHERYESLDWPQQLGNLASTLARVSARASSAQHDALVIDLLREAALLIEWSAPHRAFCVLAGSWPRCNAKCWPGSASGH